MFFDDIGQLLLSHQARIVLNRIVDVEVGEAEFETVAAFQESRCGDDRRQRQRQSIDLSQGPNDLQKS